MDATAWQETRHQHPDIQRLPDTLRMYSTTANQIPQIMKAKTYITEIRAQVKANHNGEVPKELEGTIRDYAYAKELRDVYREKVIEEPTIVEVGSMGNMTTKQNPLCNLLYQQESLCQGYAKMLGLTAAKAAMKTEPTDSVGDDDPMAKYYQGK
jgi:hypothetical protein